MFDIVIGETNRSILSKLDQVTSPGDYILISTHTRRAVEISAKVKALFIPGRSDEEIETAKKKLTSVITLKNFPKNIKESAIINKELKNHCLTPSFRSDLKEF